MKITLIFLYIHYQCSQSHKIGKLFVLDSPTLKSEWLGHENLQPYICSSFDGI